jgi:hypothetical protein
VGRNDTNTNAYRRNGKTTKKSAHKKMIVCLTIAILMFSSFPFISHSVHAQEDTWFRLWRGNSWQNEDLAGQNVSATTTVTSADGYYWGEFSLVATVYQYQPYAADRDMVVIKLALSSRSHCSEIVPHPDPTETVIFEIEKDSDGSNLQDQEIHFDTNSPEYNQGYGLDQPCYISSGLDKRLEWGLGTMVWAIGCFVPEVGIAYTIATQLISAAHAYLGDPAHKQPAQLGDSMAWSVWDNPGYSFNDSNPIEQYAFNTIQWKQKQWQPDTYYGIKISALVLPFFKFLSPDWIYVGPIYLQIGRNPDAPPVTLDISSTPVSTAVYIDGDWRGSTYNGPLTVTVQSGWHTMKVQDVVYVRKRIGPHKWTAKKYVFKYWAISGINYPNNPISWGVDVDGEHLTAVYYFAGTVTP